MILEYTTKRDVNGNRYYLGVDTEAKTYSTTRSMWYGRDDVLEISKKDRRKLIEVLDRQGFTEVNHIGGTML